MVRIGLLSDTHGYLDPEIFRHFKDCNELWHAGDIGGLEVSEQLKAKFLLRGVHGNIDGQQIRIEYPAEQNFLCEGIKVYITHIGGYPGNYSPPAKKIIESNRPGLFICGHSHILKVMHDKKFNLLHMNPGAAGKHGFHKFRTILRFAIDQGKIIDVEAIELGLRGSID